MNPPALLAGALLVGVASCGGDGGATGPDPGAPPGPATGSMDVSAATSGEDADPDGYTANVGGQSRELDPDGAVTFEGLEEGPHDVELTGVRANCSVSGVNPQTVDVEAGAVAATNFDVVCRDALVGEIAYASDRNDGNGDIFIQAADGPAFTRLTADTAIDRYPSVSADGTRILFSSLRDATEEAPFDEEIYLMSADGSDPRPLAPHPARDRRPDWAPDGSLVAFETRRDGNFEIYRMRSDGTELVNLTRHDSLDAQPDWSPDGDRILFASDRDGDADIYVMSAVDGSGVVNLTRNEADDAEPRWSPDGSRVLFVSTRDDPDAADVHVMDADGSSAQNLTQTPGVRDREPTWSADGSHVAFRTHRDGNAEIYVMDLETGELTNLTKNGATDAQPSWSPVR